MVVKPGIIWAESGIIWWSRPVLVFSLNQAEQQAEAEVMPSSNLVGVEVGLIR